MGIRNIDNQRWDVFFPQLLYNYKLPYGFSIGGSIVKVVEKNNVIVDKGNAIDISVYVPLKNIVKQNSRIKEAYFATTTFVDAQVGRILNKLRQTGLDKNTIIVGNKKKVFYSDIT